VQASAVKANEGLAGVREGLPRFNCEAYPVGRVRLVYSPREGGSDFLGRTGLVGGARLLQRQGAGHCLLGGGVPEAHHAKGDHSGRPHLSPVVQQDPGAGADSGLFDQVHGKGEVSLCSSVAHYEDPAEERRGQVEAVYRGEQGAVVTRLHSVPGQGDFGATTDLAESGGR
jgi:hypothetical protein